MLTYKMILFNDKARHGKYVKDHKWQSGKRSIYNAAKKKTIHLKDYKCLTLGAKIFM